VENHHLHDFFLMKAPYEEQTLYEIENAAPMAVEKKGEEICVPIG
jgi:hypothetical protein